jgi:hypothetical protein
MAYTELLQIYFGLRTGICGAKSTSKQTTLEMCFAAARNLQTDNAGNKFMME